MPPRAWFVKYWYVIPVIPVGIVVTFKLIRLNRSGAYILDKLKLKIPVMGMIVEKTIVARTMCMLGTLISSGVPILEALSVARETSMNIVFEEMFQRVYELIREGETIANPMRECKLVDEMVVNMIDVGEETGDLDTMLNKVADVYEEEVDVLVESLISLLEPLMIVVLGIIVGTIVIALFMPLLELLDGLSGGKKKRQAPLAGKAAHVKAAADFRAAALTRILQRGKCHAQDPVRMKSRRAGMTLIELLVVIAIIAILVSLLTVAVMAVRNSGVDATNRQDIEELSVALSKFKTDKQIYRPSKIVLYANASQDYTSGSAAHQHSLQYINALWPNIGDFSGMNWAGYDQNSLPIAVPATGIHLEGDQCLVFFGGHTPS